MFLEEEEVSKNHSIIILRDGSQFFHHESQSLWQPRIYHSDVEVRFVILQLEFESQRNIYEHKEEKDC